LDIYSTISYQTVFKVLFSLIGELLADKGTAVELIFEEEGREKLSTAKEIRNFYGESHLSLVSLKTKEFT
jgi:hypothetical protein